jgi:hypothetical protein
MITFRERRVDQKCKHLWTFPTVKLWHSCNYCTHWRRNASLNLSGGYMTWYPSATGEDASVGQRVRPASATEHREAKVVTPHRELFEGACACACSWQVFTLILHVSFRGVWPGTERAAPGSCVPQDWKFLGLYWLSSQRKRTEWCRGRQGPGTGSGPTSDDSNQTSYRTFRPSSGRSFFAYKKLSVAAPVLPPWRSQTAETNRTDWVLWGIFVAVPSQEQFETTSYKHGVR